MLKNMATWDRVVRALIFLTVLVLYLTQVISGTLALILGALSIILLITSFLGFCPLYLPFKFSTKKQI